MKTYMKIFLLAILVLFSGLVAYDFLGQPVVQIDEHYSRTEIEQLQSQLKSQGVDLDIEILVYNELDQIEQIAGSVCYFGQTSGSFSNDQFTKLTVRGGLLHMDVSFQ